MRPKRLKDLLSKTFLLLAFLVSAGCASTLNFKYDPPKKAEPVKGLEHVTVYIEPVKDARPPEQKIDPRTIGRINAPVADMSGAKLTLGQDVKDIVETAFVEELRAAGYNVKTAPGEGEDFVVTGEVKDFRLDIEGRDKVSIILAAKVVEKETGRALWDGTVTEAEERYAGVMGNSSASINKYLSHTLSKAVRKVVSESSEKIANTRAAYAPALQEEKEKKIAEGSGRLVVQTDPPRSKVYINDVYYGLTPLSLDIEPGVYELSVRQKGFKEEKEKVSVRAGQFTELEVRLDRE